MKKKLFLLFLGFPFAAYTQNVGIGTATPDPSAKMDILDPNRGILIPRVALSATNVAAPVTAPATSLLIYNTATAGTTPNNVTPGFYYWSGTQWLRMKGTNTPDWTTSGNAGTIDNTHFIGTTDNVPFNIRVNNQPAGKISTAITALGYQAGISNTTVDNTAIGNLALTATTGGHNNTALGSRALLSNVGGMYNVAVGSRALSNNIGGHYNVAIGSRALEAATGAWGNIAIGTNALVANTGAGGGGNTVVGSFAMEQSITGTANAAIGHRAFNNSTTASLNVAIGEYAGSGLVSGNNNTFLGPSTGTTLGTITNATAVGANVSLVQSNSLILGNNAFVGIGTNVPNQRLTVNGSMEIQDQNDNVLVSRNNAETRHHQMIGTHMGWDRRGVYLGGYNQNNLGAGPYNATNRIYCGGSFGSLPITATAFTVASSQRYKQNIVPVAYGLSAIMQLRPVQYQYTFEALKQTRVGLIAEEVNKVIPEIVVKQDEKGEETTDVNGKTMGINYSELTPVLIKAMQEQQAQIEALKKQNEALEKRLQAIEGK